MFNFFRALTGLITSISILLGSLSASAQSVPLTFSVDMTHENVSSAGVHVAGDFQSEAGFGSDWQPGATSLTDPDGDKVFERTVMVPPGTYLYKFVNGDDWNDKPEHPPSACSVSDGSGNQNRQVTVSSDGVDLPTTKFDSCGAILYLSVNMEGVPVSGDGVHVMGDFQESAGFPANWDPSSTQMTDLNGDGTFEISLPVSPGTYHYKFVNGNSEQAAEVVPSSCAQQDGMGRTARRLAIGVTSTPGETVCFGSCDTCDPSIATGYQTHWWNDAVFYEIFVRSFYDSDGDGIGDFQGIIEKLDYLNDGDPETTTDLGVTGIWLMPMMPSPSYHGYDVTDYYGIEPDYGTMADFEEFLAEAHARGIRVIIDYVMNHTSSQHPWFTQSSANLGSFRDWYIWRDNNPGFNGPWGQTVWHALNGDYFYGLFWSGMPDLNYDNASTREEMMDIARFWIDKGVDGFRLDAIKYLDEDGTVLENTPKTFELLEELRMVYKDADADAVTVGEVWSSTQAILPFVHDERLDLCFDFDLAFDMVHAVNFNDPDEVKDQIEVMQAGYNKLQYATFLSNHDIDRLYSRFSSNPPSAKHAVSLLLTLPGVPFIYYGDEVGMTGTGPDENVRRPMQWDAGPTAGFTTGSPWQAPGSNFVTNNVSVMEADSGSLLSHHKRFIHLRNAFAPLRNGYLLSLESSNTDFLSFARVYGDEAAIVISSFESTTRLAPLLNMPISSLPAGQYKVIDGLTMEDYGQLTLDDNGGFTDFQLTELVDPRQTLVLMLTPMEATSTTSVRETIQVEIFPNPASDWVQIDLVDTQAETRVSLIDAKGQVINSTTFSGKSTRIEVTGVPAGAYFIMVQHDDGVVVKRVVID